MGNQSFMIFGCNIKDNSYNKYCGKSKLLFSNKCIKHK